MVVTNPGVQKPHWRPWQSWKACCTGPRPPPAARQPSTVVISAPSTPTANSRQERIGRPSTRTVQAPQTPCSQPTWVPVSPRSWRRQSDSSRRAGTDTVRGTPLTTRWVSCSGLAHADCSNREAAWAAAALAARAVSTPARWRR